jgi:hypothetical protein
MAEGMAGGMHSMDARSKRSVKPPLTLEDLSPMSEIQAM